MVNSNKQQSAIRKMRYNGTNQEKRNNTIQPVNESVEQTISTFSSSDINRHKKHCMDDTRDLFTLHPCV